METLLAMGEFLAENAGKVPRTGQTPHVVLHRDRNACVRYFAPTEAKHPPVFVCMPLINTWTIFDLLPGRSVVEKLVGEGVPVYLLDWGRPGPEGRHTTVQDLVDGVLRRSMDRARRHAGVFAMDAIGYCVGGTFLAVYTARYPKTVRRLCLVATPIDFHASGRLRTWADPESFPVDDIVDGVGNFPKALMRTSFQWLRPDGQVARWRSLLEGMDRPGFTEVWAAIEHWNADGVDFPGEAYREYVRRCYFDNALMSGTWTLGNDRVDLSKAGMSALVLSASSDHIVPPAAADGLASVWGGPVTCRVLEGGHVGICLGRALPAALLEWVKA